MNEFIRFDTCVYSKIYAFYLIHFASYHDYLIKGTVQHPFVSIELILQLIFS